MGEMHTRSYDVSLSAEGCHPSTSAPTTEDSGSDGSTNDSDDNAKRLSWKTKIFFSFGHIYNDLCASIWFSYTLIFFQMQFKGTTAGILILLGQVADALATPFVGFQSDRNNTNNWLCRYGKRKTWHLLGTILVTASFPLIFNKCIVCENAPEIGQIVYYGVFIVLFQFGWAAVQVGHVSLITDLSTNSKERVELNAYRQASTVGASICVYTIAWLALSREGDSSIKKEDSGVFTNLVYIVCAIGLVFSVLFHLFVWENKSPESGSPTQSRYGSSDDLINKSHYRKRVCSISSVYECGAQKDSVKSYGTSGATPNGTYSKGNPENGTKSVSHYKWSDWLKCVNFYKVAFIYMVSRLFVNLTQVYTPLFLQRTLDLRKTSIAIIPFVTYISGFVWSLICKYISAKTGPKILLLLGCIFGLGSCVWNDFGSIDNESFKQWQVYGAALLFGIGGTTMLIASLALTSDLIGCNTMSSAFVFGTMSFFDKVLNGGVVVILEQINPYKDQDEEHVSIPFYQNIVVYVSGATCVLTVMGILMIIKTNLIESRRKSHPRSKICNESSNVETVKY